MNCAARRISCGLPRSVQSFCEMGCIYRESSFRHLGCPRATKLDGCFAPCHPDDCSCVPKKKDCIVRTLTKKEKNEVFLLQKEDTPRVQMLM